ERIFEWCEEKRTAGSRLMVVEIPLLFESGMDTDFDATVVVVADEEVRRARVEQGGVSQPSERDSRQLTQAEKAVRATYILDNSGTLGELKDSIEGLITRLEESSK